MHSVPDQEGDPQDNFVEAREPTELVMCVLLAAAYTGLARYCWEPLHASGNWRLLVNVEGFFLTIAVLSLLVGLRPYLSPCSLQLSKKGIKYHGPYWPQRKTVNWEQVFRLYVSPELCVVLYHTRPNRRGIWPMFIQSVYLADRERVWDAMIKYSPVPPVPMKGPSLTARFLFVSGFAFLVIWILEMLLG